MLAGIALVLAQAPAARSGSQVMIQMMVYVVAFGLIMWFVLLRPQRKMQDRHKQMIAELKKGDDVVTDGGIIGSIIHLADDRVTVKTAENTRIVVARSKIARVMSAPGTTA
jgi:preprotein translocase subunit YajC